MEKTIQVSDQELRSTLHEFLEEEDKKPKESVWNFSTLTGIALVLTSAAFVGHAISTEVFGIPALSFVSSLVSVTPYIGATLLSLILISTFVKNKQDKKIEEKEEEQVQKTYDKLDAFLYNNNSNSSRRSTKKKKETRKKKSHDSFKISSVHKLMKSRTDKKISGVCGGLAKYLGINSTIIRIIFVLALLLGYGSFLLVYFAMSIVMPKEPVSEMADFF